jgi:glycosyltransferase involved in cell wall biosynthesis
VKLLLINWQDRLNPLAGGAEEHLHEIFGRIAKRDHEVSLLVSGWSGGAAHERVDGMDVHRVGTRYTFNAAVIGYYRRRLAQRPFDLVIEALNKVPVFSPAWSGRPGMLVVHHLFGATAFREASVPLAAMTWLLERPLPFIYRDLPVEAISRSTADDLIARGLRPQNVRVIHPGVDLEFFTPDASVTRSAEPSFLYLGRLRRYKGIDLTIRALAQLIRSGMDARLVVAGRGEYLDDLRLLASRLGIEDRVTFAGFVSHERKRDLFRGAWANLFPSPKEGWGITNLEAAACGTPSIASDSPGLRESVVDGETGILVPHGDVDALAQAMRRLASDRATVELLGAGAQRFASGFTWERAATETEAHMRELMDRTVPAVGERAHR